jgi:hypothetical protein
VAHGDYFRIGVSSVFSGQPASALTPSSKADELAGRLQRYLTCNPLGADKLGADDPASVRGCGY